MKGKYETLRKTAMIPKQLQPYAFKPGPAEEADRPKGGRKKLSEIEKEARDASRIEIAELWIELKGKTLGELEEMVKDYKSLPAVKALYIKNLINGIKEGDTSELHRMYDRLIGKPKQAIDHNFDSDLSEKLEINIGFKKPIQPTEPE